MDSIKSMCPTLLSFVFLVASAFAQQIDLADDEGRRIFDSSTANKTYVIKNEGPDGSIKIWRKHGDTWEVIATLAAGESHSVTPAAGDQLGASDPKDNDTDGATVSWTIT